MEEDGKQDDNPKIYDDAVVQEAIEYFTKMGSYDDVQLLLECKALIQQSIEDRSANVGFLLVKTPSITKYFFCSFVSNLYYIHLFRMPLRSLSPVLMTATTATKSSYHILSTKWTITST